MPPTIFPTVAEGGPQHTKYTKLTKEYKDATVINPFEDRGVSIVETADDVEQRWEFIWEGLTEAEAKVLDDHWDSARLSQGFDFTEPRDVPWTGTTGTVYADQTVYYESYGPPDHTKVWIQARKAVLVRRPVN